MRRAGRWRPILALAALGAGCAPRPPIGGAVPGLQVVVPGDGVEFGMPFPLTVVRRWPEGSRVPPFDPTTLTPLVVVPAGQTRRSDGTRVEETLRFTARAFERGALTLTASFELPGAGGGAQVVTAPPTTLTVRSALAAAANANPAEAELPGDVLLEGGNRAVWMFAGVEIGRAHV